MKNKKLLLTPIVFLPIFSMIGCPGDKCGYWKDPACNQNGALEGGFCDQSPDCLNSLICINHMCRRPCNSDWDCDFSQVCENDVCIYEQSTNCGDGIVDWNEFCDDGNKVNRDGCSNKCQVEKGYICKGEPSKCQLIDDYENDQNSDNLPSDDTNSDDANSDSNLNPGDNSDQNSDNHDSSSDSNTDIQPVNPGNNGDGLSDDPIDASSDVNQEDGNSDNFDGNSDDGDTDQGYSEDTTNPPVVEGLIWDR